MIYTAKLKTREDMEETIPRENWGWWIDVCPGQILTLRNATESDLERCILGEHSSKDPDDYLCELSKHGALVSKVAIESMEELTA